MLVFVNGIPLGHIELKNPTDENADCPLGLPPAQTYAQEIPSLLRFNEVMVVSDGVEARIGSLTAAVGAVHALADAGGRRRGAARRRTSWRS